jgi:hypothetical protein
VNTSNSGVLYYKDQKCPIQGVQNIEPHPKSLEDKTTSDVIHLMSKDSEEEQSLASNGNYNIS